MKTTEQLDRDDTLGFLRQLYDLPTDNYIAEGLARLLGPDRCEVVAIPLDDLDTTDLHDAAVVSLAHVDFRTGACRDIAGITKRVHDAGALVLWCCGIWRTVRVLSIQGSMPIRLIWRLAVPTSF